MATLWDAIRGREARALAPSGIPPASAWPDLYGEEAAQEALQDAQRALRLAEACAATGAIGGQPTEADLADPDQEWIEITTLGDAKPRYVRGRR